MNWGHRTGVRALWAGLAIALLLLAPGAPGEALAQAKEPIRVLSREAENDYPHGLTFVLRAEADRPLARIEVYYRTQGGGSTMRQPADFEPGAEVLASYAWDTSRIAVAPSTPVIYYWKLADADAQGDSAGDAECHGHAATLCHARSDQTLAHAHGGRKQRTYQPAVRRSGIRDDPRRRRGDADPQPDLTGFLSISTIQARFPMSEQAQMTDDLLETCQVLEQPIANSNGKLHFVIDNAPPPMI